MTAEPPGPEGVGSDPVAAEAPNPPLACPRCQSDLGVERCPRCGLEVTASLRATLTDLEDRRRDALERRDRAAAEVASAEHELQAIAADRFALGAPPPPPPSAAGVAPAPPPSWPPASERALVPEWEPLALQTWLLVIGVGLLLLAGLAFVVVAWPDLDDAQRAGVLGLATAVAGGLSGGLRRRLPATADALCVLGMLLLLVDWGALRKAGVAADLDAAWWWAAGQALVALAGLGAHRAGLRSPLVASPALGVGAGLAVVAATADALWTVAAGVGIVALATTVTSTIVRSAQAEVARRTLQSLALAVWTIGAVLAAGEALGRIGEAGGPRATLGPALALLVAAASPAVVRARPVGGDDALVGRADVHGSAIGELATATSGALVLGALGAAVGHSHDLVTVGLVVAGAGAVAVLLDRRGPAALTGLALAGLLAAAPAAAVGVGDGLDALSAPWSLLDEPFTASVADRVHDLDHPWAPTLPPHDDRRAALALVPLLVVAAAGAGAVDRRRRPVLAATPAWVLGSGLAVLGLSTAAVTVGDPVVAVPVAVGSVLAVVAIVVAVERGRSSVDVRDPAVRDGLRRVQAALAGVAATAAVPAVGWALQDGTWAAPVLALLATLAGAAGVLLVGRAERQLLAATSGALALATAWAALEPGWSGTDAELRAVLAGVAVAVALVGVARGERDDAVAVESTGLVAAAVLSLSVLDERGLGPAMVSATAAVLLVAALRQRRPAEQLLAPLGAAFAALLWLGELDVEAVEAYSVVAGAGVLGAKLWPRGGVDGRSSGAVYRLPLLVALGPPVLVALGDPGQVRPAGLTLVCLGLIVVGAQRRLRAPLEAGALGLALLGIDLLAPYATELPRWVTLGGAGAVVLWLGATVERRLAEVRAARERFASFG